MEDSFEDFQVKKKINTGPKIVPKDKKKNLKKLTQRSKGQKDIRSLIKKNELVSYSQDFHQVCKQNGVDVDAEQLQLAIALSKSLNEVQSSSEDVEVQNKKLSSQERSAKIRTTLQEYGFKVNNSKILSLSTNKRKKYKNHSKLLHTSNQEREKKIFNKYSKVLASNICQSPYEDPKCIYLKHTIFYKATNILYETLKNNDLFYVNNLIEKPTHRTCLLRDWSEIPGRPVSPKPKHNDIDFDTIHCSQVELDDILSGSVETAQIIINNKQSLKENNTDSCNDNACIKYNETVNIIDPIPSCSNDSKTIKEQVTQISETKDQIDDIDHGEKCNSIKENIECIDLIKENSFNDNYLQKKTEIVSQNLNSNQFRSTSPDLFDDEVSFIIEDKNHNSTIKTNEVCLIIDDKKGMSIESISIHDNCGTICMDLTECAYNIHNNLDIRNTDITKRKSNDLMDITECVNVKSRNNKVDIILSSGETLEDNKVEENVELVDLTQVLNIVEGKAIEKSGTKNSVPLNIDDTVIYENDLFTKTVHEGKDLDEPIILDEDNISKDLAKDKKSYVEANNSDHNSCKSDNENDRHSENYNVEDNELGDQNNYDINIDLTQDITQSENNYALNYCEYMYHNSELESLKHNSGILNNGQDNDIISLKDASCDNDIENQDVGIDLTQDSEKSFETTEENHEISYPGTSYNNKSRLENFDYVGLTDYKNNSVLIVENIAVHSAPVEKNYVDDKIDLTQVTEEIEERYNANGHSYVAHKNNSKLGKIDNISIDYDEMFDEIISESKNVSKNTSKSNASEKDDVNASNPSINSEVFEISDKELNYSIHHSVHENFNIDFATGRVSLNRSLSESNVNTVNLCNLLSPIKEKQNSQPNTPIKINTGDAIKQTPKNTEYIIKTGNVTPMADYESMTTPERNNELDKYGLKPFKRKRAIQLLTYVYNQTHPVIESCSPEEGPPKRLKRDNKNSSPKKNSKSPKKCLNFGSDVNKENDIFLVTKETPDIKNIECDPKEWVFQNREMAKIPSCRVPLHIAFHNYVSCRRLLKEAILRYEPVNIDIIHRELVSYGHKYNPKDLLKFMDRKCITVKTVENNTRNKRT